MFGSSKKIISRNEFDEVLSALYSKGFTKYNRDEVIKIFRGDLHETRTNERGIDEEELTRGLKWMRANISSHRISKDRIDMLEKVMRDKF